MYSNLEAQVKAQLATIPDPELNVDIVALGLIYSITVAKVQAADGELHRVHIVMTLTTPGCPLAGVFEGLIRSALAPLTWIKNPQDITIELTFDPPWLPDMMSEEARAELNL